MTDPLSIVRNRTTTQKHDEMKARERADAERRRAELDQKRALTKKERGAKLHTHALGGTQTHPSIVVKLIHKDGSTADFETCELSVDIDGFTLILVCPVCLFRHNRPMDDCQITLRSWHRRFELVRTHEGKTWVNDKPPPGMPNDVVLLAGAIQTVDVQTCPVCSGKFHLEPSKNPNEPGVTVYREVREG